LKKSNENNSKSLGGQQPRNAVEEEEGDNHYEVNMEKIMARFTNFNSLISSSNSNNNDDDDDEDKKKSGEEDDFVRGDDDKDKNDEDDRFSHLLEMRSGKEANRVIETFIVKEEPL